MSETQKQSVILMLDLMGWEQDGEGLDFIHLPSGNRESFKSYEDALDFIGDIS